MSNWNTTENLPEIGRPVWLADAHHAWIGWREIVADGDDDQSGWRWSAAAYPPDFIDEERTVTRWSPIDEPPLLGS